jgi:Tol biopolymer transport system component
VTTSRPAVATTTATLVIAVLTAMGGVLPSASVGAATPALAGATTLRVSVTGPAAPMAAESGWPRPAADGRVVAFATRRANLDGGAPATAPFDVVLRDPVAQTTVQLSRNLGDTAGANGDSKPLDITPDGRFVLFVSNATDLVAPSASAPGVCELLSTPGELIGPGRCAIYRWDRDAADAAERIVRVSVKDGAAALEGNGDATEAAISDDGNLVAFSSTATDLVAGDTNLNADVFVRDVDAGTTRRVSIASGIGGQQGLNGPAKMPAISGNGQVVAYTSNAPNLLDDDGNEWFDVLVRDLATHTTQLVSADVDGAPADWDSFAPSLSADGRYVAFESNAENLVENDINNATDVFVRDRQAETTVLASMPDGGSGFFLSSHSPSLSDDGRSLAFESESDLFDVDDDNGLPDVFVRDLESDAVERVSLNAHGQQATGQPAHDAVISPDGGFVAFASAEDQWQPASDANGATDVFLRDLAGVLPVGSLFTAVDPVRILDSRPGSQVGPFTSPWGSQETRDVVVTGGDVPERAVAVALNVTVTGTTASSNLRVWPKGLALPTVSSLNWQAGWTVPNAVTVKVGEAGRVSVYNNNGNADVVIDVVGFYAVGEGAGYTALEPERILDSRPESQVGPFDQPWSGQQTRSVTVAGVGGVPANADAVVLNVTVTGTTASSNLRVWPAGPGEVPTASSLNWQAGWTIPNAVTVKVGDSQAVDVYNNNGNAHVVIDVVGYFDLAAGEAFHPLDPTRIQDSRTGSQVGPYDQPWPAGIPKAITVTGGDVPAHAAGVLLNVTVTGTTDSSNLRIYPTGLPVPTVSSLNWQPGWTIPNAVTAKVGDNGQIDIYNNRGTTHVIADLAGWYG